MYIQYIYIYVCIIQSDNENYYINKIDYKDFK